MTATTAPAPAVGLPDSMKLLIGAGGIYGAFLYYGSLQEDVFRFVGASDQKFTQAWFLQVLEAVANVVVGFLGMMGSGICVAYLYRRRGVVFNADV